MLASGTLFFATAMTSPALAASASAAADPFHISPEDLKANQTPLGLSDPDFRALHNSWGRVNNPMAKIAIAVPSINPVDIMNLSSGFGPRRAPMRGASRYHKGLDIPGPIGSPIYATADGIIGRAQIVSGYGKFIEINHGNDIQTRYGHMSALNVQAGQYVHKGDVIGFMGSTGRSTGSHLHYEIRVGGEAVNPTAFLGPVKQSPLEANRLLAAQHVDTTASGGPAD